MWSMSIAAPALPGGSDTSACFPLGKWVCTYTALCREQLLQCMLRPLAPLEVVHCSSADRWVIYTYCNIQACSKAAAKSINYIFLYVLAFNSSN